MIRRLKKSRGLAVAAQLIFLAYLFCPIDAGQLRPDGRILHVYGWGLVVQTLCSIEDSLLGHFLFYIFFLPVNAVNLLLVTLPFLPRISWFQKNWAKFYLVIIIIIGSIEYYFLFVQTGQSGAWLWLAATALAMAHCLTSINYQAVTCLFKKAFWFSRMTITVCSTTTLFAGLLCLFAYKIYYGEIFGDERETLTSPDGHYKIVVLARGIDFFASAPGDAGGAPGNVSIIDLKSHKRIGRELLEMVQFADSCTWTTTNVTIVDVGQWQLPSGKFDNVW